MKVIIYIFLLYQLAGPCHSWKSSIANWKYLRRDFSSHPVQTKCYRYRFEIASQTTQYDEQSTLLPISVPANITNLYLGFSQIKTFLNIATPFFAEDKTARGSLIGVIALTFLNSGVSVAFSYISRDFYNALNARNQPEFYEKIELFFAALVIAVPVTVYYRFLREKLALYWREALTTRVLKKYYANRTFYVLETMHNIDNPDQRISEDISSFTRTSLSFLITLLTSAIDLFSFSAILYQINPSLFLAIILYAGIGSFITTNLGRKLVGLNYDQLIKEANFRFALIRTRENAEAIALYDPDAQLELQGLCQIFQQVLSNQLGIVTVQRNLEYFTTAYRYLVQILPSLIVAPLYFQGKVELGSISQSYGAFNHILGDFSLIINSFESLSAFSAGLTRLNTFLKRIEEGGWSAALDVKDEEELGLDSQAIKLSGADKIRLVERIATPAPEMAAHSLLECSNLTVLTPDASRVLIGAIPTAKGDLRGVNAVLKRGDRVLIVGPSGAGKSSFIRAISGLWQVGFGTVTWWCDPPSTQPPTEGPLSTDDSLDIQLPKDVFFLPQKPYNFMGTLRQQIQYPSIKSQSSTLSAAEEEAEDGKLLELLRDVRLGDLAARVGGGNERAGLSAILDWSNVLSLGEQQRLAFARVLFNRPATVVLDEATSALDLATEKQMYSLLRDYGTTYLSVGHRPSLLRYHDTKLVLLGAGQDIVMTAIDHGSEDPLIDLSDANTMTINVKPNAMVI